MLEYKINPYVLSDKNIIIIMQSFQFNLNTFFKINLFLKHVFFLNFI